MEGADPIRKHATTVSVVQVAGSFLVVVCEVVARGSARSSNQYTSRIMPERHSSTVHRHLVDISRRFNITDLALNASMSIRHLVDMSRRFKVTPSVGVVWIGNFQSADERGCVVAQGEVCQIMAIVYQCYLMREKGWQISPNVGQTLAKLDRLWAKLAQPLTNIGNNWWLWERRGRGERDRDEREAEEGERDGEERKGEKKEEGGGRFQEGSGRSRRVQEDAGGLRRRRRRRRSEQLVEDLPYSASPGLPEPQRRSSRRSASAMFSWTC